MIAEDAPPLQGRALARRLAPWFELQLTFAARCTELGALSPAEAITQYTAIYKRMGFGPNARGKLHEDWLALCPALNEAEGVEAQFSILKPELERRIVGYRHYSEELFGCFSFDAPNDEGVVKLHFIPDHSDAAAGPLHNSNRDARRAELSAMVAHIHHRHGETAKTVRGLSWLYHTEAYRALFPESFAASVRRDSDAAARPQGMRYWGQFLTHRGELREDVARTFRSTFKDLALNRLADAYPYPPLRAEAPIGVFYQAYLT